MWQCIEQAISVETDKDFIISDKQTIGLLALQAYLVKIMINLYNLSFKVTDGERSFFIKLNRKECLINFQAEAYSLKQLKSLTHLACPNVTAIGTSLDKSFLVLDYIDFSKAKPVLWYQLGQQLAQMHYETQHGQFGWQHDNLSAILYSPIIGVVIGQLFC